MGIHNKTTIQEVARLAGVSSMTVSRAMNQPSVVSKASLDLVMCAARKLNYKHTNSKTTIALFYIDLESAYTAKFVVSAINAAKHYGLAVELFELQLTDDYLKQQITDAINFSAIDKAILLPIVSEHTNVLETIERLNVPFIRVSPDADLKRSPYIGIDEYHAAFELTQYLIDKGHTQIAHVKGAKSYGASQLRYRGYLDAMRSNQLEIDPMYVEFGEFTYGSGYLAASRLLSLAIPPTAIFCANDEMAIAAIQVAQVLGKEVPGDIAIVGFDDAPIAKSIVPQLTTVRQPIERMCNYAFELLLDSSSMKNNDNRITSHELIVRGSV